MGIVVVVYKLCYRVRLAYFNVIVIDRIIVMGRVERNIKLAPRSSDCRLEDVPGLTTYLVRLFDPNIVDALG